MAVLVTLSPPAGEALCQALAERGIESLHAPVLTFEPRDKVELSGASDLIITARSALEFIPSGAWRIWCVGPQTAEAAQAAGFMNVNQGPGDADGLAEHILTAGDAGSHYVHVANARAGTRLTDRLAAAGLEARTCHAYRTACRGSFSATVHKAFDAGGIHAVTLHSAFGARCFCALTRAIDLSGLACIAQAPSVADALSEQASRFSQILVVRTPDRQSLLESVQIVMKSA